MSWKSVRFSDLVESPPKIKLKKGEQYSFIPMEDVDPSTKFADSSYEREYTGGGAKFADGDTIFARITPCLEHGKIAKVSGLRTEIGFGSTEFIVFRAKEGISDPDFIYYLAKSNNIKGPAIKSMVGSSGRQRARLDVIEEISINVPDINTQHRIALFLSAYDNLIENNRRRIQLLEQSARLLYREWFVSLRFPGHEHVRIIDGVPEGWELKRVEDVAEAIGGGTPSTKVTEYWDDGEITWFIPSDLTKNDCLVLLKSERKITEVGLKESSAKMLPPETILMTSRATLGFFGLYDGKACTNQGFISIIPRIENFRMYMLQNLIYRKEQIISLAGGTTYKEINKTTFRNMNIVIPSLELLKEYEEFAYNLIKQVRIIKKQNQKLIEARDILLPRLMNGAITV